MKANPDTKGTDDGLEELGEIQGGAPIPLTALPKQQSQLVSAAFEAVVGRAPTSSEAQTWARTAERLLRDGATPAQAAKVLQRAVHRAQEAGLIQ